MPSNEKDTTAARLVKSRWAHFILDRDEALTTANAINTVTMHAVHSNSGELLDEERNAISWLLYVLQEIQSDITEGIPQ